MVDSLLEHGIQLEDEYVSDARGKILFLKARCYVEERTCAQPAHGKSWWKYFSARPQGTTHEFRRGSRKAIDKRRQSSVEVRTQRTPHGVISTVEKMIELLELPPGWNSYNARPITKENVGVALSLLGRLMRADTPAPNVVPMVRGGVQLEWHTRGINLEISIYSPDQVTILAEDLHGGDNPAEGDLDINSLDDWIDRLSR